MDALTLPEQFFRTAARFGDRTAFLHKPGDRYVSVSFPEVSDEIRAVASALMSLGLMPGDRAAILMENRPQWITSDLGIMLAGGVCVPLHTTFSPRLIAAVLKDSGSRFLLVSGADSLEKAVQILPELPGLEKIIVLQSNLSAGLPPERFLLWDDFLKSGANEASFPARSSDDLASLLYTSGTTGDPKGVMLTHRNFLSNAFAALKAIPFNEQDVLLSFLPLSHSLPRLGDYYAAWVAAGATLAFAKNLKELPKNITEIRPTTFIAVPRIFESVHDGIRQKIRQKGKLAEALLAWGLRQKVESLSWKLTDRLLFAKIRHGLGGRLRFCVSGGAGLNPYLAWFFGQIGLPILEGYGLTETSPVVSVNRLGRAKIGTVGPPLEGVEVTLAEDREILVRGPNVTPGYWNNTAATRELLDEQGRLHTGDLGSFDEEGHLKIIGRKKELIVTAAGKNVWPEPLEAALKKSRYILQAMVSGEGQTLMSALIVPDWTALEGFLKGKGIVALPKDILKHPQVLALYRAEIDRVNADLAEYEHIARFTIVEHEFTTDREELTPSLKLVRRVIAAHYAEALAEMGRGKRG
jgi:long-chain acyl-CoA synthetase